MVECYSALYEEGEVERINGPTHPRLAIGMLFKASSQKAKVGMIWLGFYTGVKPLLPGGAYVP